MLRHLLTLKDYSSEEIEKIINKAIEIKKNPQKYSEILKNKTLIMLFQKTSTRTRLSFETGMTQLGGHAIFLDWKTTQFKIAEFIDEIRAVMRFGDILMFRALKHEYLQEAAKVATIPIINGLCNKYHPCQALGDMLTMVEKSGGKIENIRGKKLVFLGIANNVSNSLIEVCTKLGMKITLCVPEKNLSSYDPELEEIARKTGLYEETTDLSCISDADFVYTDTWIDMEFFDEKGNVVPEFKEEFERRKKILLPYQLNVELLEKYHSNAKIMHDMPCHPGYEITREAIEHKNSIIFDQAENRLHIQKAIILFLLNKF
jgi:ornithine carbamoyltransferase